MLVRIAVMLKQKLCRLTPANGFMSVNHAQLCSSRLREIAVYSARMGLLLAHPSKKAEAVATEQLAEFNRARS